MTLPLNQDVFSIKIPPGPGWFWCKLEAFPKAIVYPVEVILDEETKCLCDSAGQPILEVVGIEWDPTPILGPGELQKRIREAYEEGWLNRDSNMGRGMHSSWTASCTRAALNSDAPGAQSTDTAENER